MTSITPPGRSAHTFDHTLDGLLEGSKAPDNPPTSYAYDADRALTTVTREGGQKVLVGYDSAGRWKDAQLAGGAVSATYDLGGRVASLAGPGAAKLAFSYDGSRLREIAADGLTTSTVGYSYDSHGRVSREKVGVLGAHDLAIVYDDDDLPLSFGPVKMSRDSATGWLSTQQMAGTYTTVERTVSENGQTTSYGEPTHWRVSLNGAAIYDLALERDELGRITKRTELIEGSTRTYGYSYDSASRLRTVEQNAVLLATYTYDASGNRLTEDATTEVAVYDGQDRLASHGAATYEHDALGNRTRKTESGVITTYEHLVGVRGGPLSKVVMQGKAISYDSDALGRRIRRIENGNATHGLVYADGLAPVALLDGQGKMLYRFVYATGRHTPDAAIDASGTSYALIGDQIGSLRLVVRSTDGVVVQRMRHDAWGRVEEDFVAAGMEPMPFGFAGGIFDRGTGLIHFGAREYEPAVGRWIEKDPIGFAGGSASLYEYVGSQPVSFIDPSGHGLVPIAVAVAAWRALSGNDGIFYAGGQGSAAAGAGLGLGGAVAGGYYVGSDGGGLVHGWWTQTAYAGPGAPFVIGHQIGGTGCFGWSKDLASFGSTTGARGTEVGVGHENLSPIPGIDLGVGISGDTTGAVPRPSGVQINIAPELTVLGSEAHVYETRTWIFP